MGSSASKENFEEFYDTVQKNNAAKRSVEITELTADILEHMRVAALAGKTSLTVEDHYTKDDHFITDMPKAHIKNCKLKHKLYPMGGETMRQIGERLTEHGVYCEYIPVPNPNPELYLERGGTLQIYFKPKGAALP